MMIPIKFRIAFMGKFYYWGFGVLPSSMWTFVSPADALISHVLSHEEIMQRSERLRGYDKFGNEVYEGDDLESPPMRGIWNADTLSADAIRQFIKKGNKHDIPEEILQEGTQHGTQ